MARPLLTLPSDVLGRRFRCIDRLWCRWRWRYNLLLRRGGDDISRDPRWFRAFWLSFWLSDRDLLAWAHRRLRHELLYRSFWRSAGQRFVTRN